jgi:hypothetical protein
MLTERQELFKVTVAFLKKKIVSKMFRCINKQEEDCDGIKMSNICQQL